MTVSCFLKTLLIRVTIIFFFLLTSIANISAQQKKKVDIIRCDLLDVNDKIVANAQRLLGNVIIKVDGATMWCDSLYNYMSNNTIDAFGKVHIVRGDTLNMYANYLNYNGDTKLAKARQNVKLIDKKITLTTDSLDYKMDIDMAYYQYSGTIKDSINILNSKIGQYYVTEKKAYFKTNVDVTTEDYKIKSDTLIYYTVSKKLMLLGPTHIFNEKDTLYAELGWYDSMKSFANLTKNPRIWNAKQKVKADSIFYDKSKSEGLAFGQARIEDIENSLIVIGNKIVYNDLLKIAYATDSAMLIQYSKTDSLFLHADRLKTIPDTVVAKKPISSSTKKNAKKDESLKNNTDSLKLDLPTALKTDSISITKNDSISITKIDSTNVLVNDSLKLKDKPDARLVMAWNKVRFFRDDFQGKCDSLVYWSKDSTIQLFNEPVLWSNKNQITAKYIEMINRTNDPNEIRMKDDAFIISMEDDSIRYNQIKGKNMVGFIRNNKLYKIDVNGNGQSNYYARDKEGVIGLNKAVSSNIVIYMNDGKVKKISFVKMPEGELKPLEQIDNTDKFLPGFMWLENLRPKNKEDIFRDPVLDEKNKVEPKVEKNPN